MIQVFVMHKTLPGSMRFAAEGLGWKTTSEHTLLYFIGRQVQVNFPYVAHVNGLKCLCVSSVWIDVT